MGNTRQWTSQFNAKNAALETAVMPAGFRSLKRRRELVNKAASGRPANLAKKAREAISIRRDLGRKIVPVSTKPGKQQ